MLSKKIIRIFLIIISITFLSYFIFSKYLKKNTTVQSQIESSEENLVSSNIVENINYVTTDADGNEYVITAQTGEIDYSDTNILYLIDVKALIKLKNSETIEIRSDFGKYNSNNFDTIFSKNVLINYLENKIKGEYLDFSLERNSIIISREVVYSNLKNTLKADVIEIDIKTKDTKIFMHEKQKRVHINNQKWYGYYKKISN